MKAFNSQETNDQETVYWAIVIFCKKIWENIHYLVVKNTETGNISFISWAKEIQDNDLIDTTKREVKEELNIDPESYKLIPTTVKHEFIFWQNKRERAWKKGSYQVFWADGEKLWTIHIAKELTSAVRMTKEKVLESLTFDDLKHIFEKATWEIKV